MNSRLRFGSSVPGARLRLPRGAPGAAAVGRGSRGSAGGSPARHTSLPGSLPLSCTLPVPSHLHLRGTAPCSQISPYDVDDALIS